MNRPVTRRQHDVLQAIRTHQIEMGLSPTLEELGSELQVNRVTAYGHVQALLQKGYLENLEPGASRGLDLTAAGAALLGSAGSSATAPAPVGNAPAFPRIPLLGRIAAGAPIEALEQPADYGLDELLPTQGELYMLQVQGDSMIDAHIQDGDWVLVRRDLPARDGHVVVAILEDETATLKRLRKRAGGGWLLVPENELLEPIPVDKLEVRGVVVGVLRRY